jgi:flagellar motor switch protein FliM
MKLERHNFNKLSKLPSELERRLLEWFEVAMAMAAKKWAKVMPFELVMVSGPIDTVRPADALAQLLENPVAYRIALHPDQVTLFITSRPLVQAVVAGLLGDTTGKSGTDRELTVVDEALFNYFLQDMVLAALQESWLGDEPLALHLEQLEPNPRRTRAFADVDKLVSSTFMLCGPFGEQNCQWLVPFKAIVALLGEAAPANGPATLRLPAPSSHMKHMVHNVPVELAVSLGTAELSLVQLARLAVGDMVILDQRVTEPLEASVGGNRKYRGWAGRIGSTQAFQIQSLTDTH